MSIRDMAILGVSGERGEGLDCWYFTLYGTLDYVEGARLDACETRTVWQAGEEVGWGVRVVWIQTP